MNIHISTIEVIPQQVQPVQHSESLLRLLVVLAEVGVGVGIGAPVATATDEDDDDCGCGDGGCGGFPVE